jgi:hypothetical protein
MLTRVRARLSYANVVATLALFVALGGSAWAGGLIGSDDIRDRSIKRVDVRKNTLTGKEIAESRLRRVPSAREAQEALLAATAQQAQAAISAQNAEALDGQSSAFFEKSSRTQFGTASATPASEDGEQVLLAWPEMGVEVTSANAAASGCGGNPAIAVRNTKTSGPSARVFQEGDAGPVVAPGAKGYDCGTDDDVVVQVTDSSLRTLFVDCIVAEGQIRCLGERSEP